MRVRSIGAYTGSIVSRVDYDDKTASDVTGEITFPDGRSRDVADVEPVTEAASANGQLPQVQTVAELPETKATERIESNAAALPDETASAAPAKAVEEEKPETALVEGDAPKATYRDALTDTFCELVPEPEDGPVILGRAILALYEYLPLEVEEGAKELADVRFETSTIVERYLPSVRAGTFGASGYALVSPALVAALSRYQEAIGLTEAPTIDRDVMLAVLELAGGSGEVAGDVSELKNAAIAALRNVPDEESLGEPLALEEIAA